MKKHITLFTLICALACTPISTVYAARETAARHDHSITTTLKKYCTVTNAALTLFASAIVTLIIRAVLMQQPPRQGIPPAPNTPAAPAPTNGNRPARHVRFEDNVVPPAANNGGGNAPDDKGKEPLRRQTTTVVAPAPVHNLTEEEQLAEAMRLSRAEYDRADQTLVRNVPAAVVTADRQLLVDQNHAYNRSLITDALKGAPAQDKNDLEGIEIPDFLNWFDKNGIPLQPIVELAEKNADKFMPIMRPHVMRYKEDRAKEGAAAMARLQAKAAAMRAAKSQQPVDDGAPGTSASFLPKQVTPAPASAPAQDKGKAPMHPAQPKPHDAPPAKPVEPVTPADANPVDKDKDAARQARLKRFEKSPAAQKTKEELEQERKQRDEQDKREQQARELERDAARVRKAREEQAKRIAAANESKPQPKPAEPAQEIKN